MPNQPLGDRKPRQLWEEINTLCRLPEIDPDTGKYRELNLKKEIWLRSLPDQIRRLLDNVNLSMEDLVTKADALADSHRAALSREPSVMVAAAAHPEQEDPTSVFAVRRPPSKRPSERPNTTAMNLATLTEGICGYHQRFGPRARRCSDGCQWQQKNARSGR
jgi:hypothetical protein